MIFIHNSFSENTTDQLIWNMTTKMNDDIITSSNTISNLNSLRTTPPSFTVQSSSEHFIEKTSIQSTTFLHQISTADQEGNLAFEMLYIFNSYLLKHCQS